MIGKIDQWDNIGYTDLSPDENQEIREARRVGFSLFYPSTTPAGQGMQTLIGAREFMRERLMTSDNRTLADKVDDAG